MIGSPFSRLRVGYGLAAAIAVLAAAPAAAQSAPGLGNDAISLVWSGEQPAGWRVVDHLNNSEVPITDLFSIELADGTKLAGKEWRQVAAPVLGEAPADPAASRLSERGARRTLTARYVDLQGRFRVELRFVQPAGAHYLREELTLTAVQRDEPIKRIELMSFAAPYARVAGEVDGSPIVAGNFYWQFENPLAKGSAHPYRGTSHLWLERKLPLAQGRSITCSEAVGVARAGQLRRDFAAYLEAERAHPARTFLQYNSWYDIGYFTPYTASQALDRIRWFGEELTVKRGVKIDSLLFDDGWDDLSGGWRFSQNFPQGFKPLATAAARYGAAPGIWLSPWGGYGGPRQQRLGAGKAAGYEVREDGFALSGPRYFERFHAAALDLVADHGINQFKIDGTGNADQVVPGSRFDSDFSAAIDLIHDLRRAKPDIFINLTTGTYPSPAWLMTADSIWRGGEDHAFLGTGTPRERWITYRDSDVFNRVVTQGPLFPLNALMVHGIIYAQSANRLNDDPGGDLANEVHSYFASGVALQELYLTPALLKPADWDEIARAARWARENAGTLKDTHWVGGDPARGDVYGWGAWSAQKSLLTLRNPDARPQSYTLDLGRALELPAGAATRYRTQVIWSAGALIPQEIAAETPVTLRLAPFEVVTVELTPEP